jgi:hypothetical protein
MSAVKLLDRLHGVKQTAPGRWSARCPAHEDKSPSLSIRELDDGRILLHDFGGCGAIDVVESLGLTMSDLFPERLAGSGPAGGFSSSQSKIPPRDLLDAFSLETTVVALIAADVLAQRAISEDDWGRLSRAVRRIHAARDLAYER